MHFNATQYQIKWRYDIINLDRNASPLIQMLNNGSIY